MSSIDAKGWTVLRSPAFLLLLPVLLFLLLFLFAPLLGMLELSFKTHSPTALWTEEFTTANYVRSADSYYLDIFLGSVRMAGVATLVCVLLGYPLAYFLARCSPSMLTLGLFLLVMPLMVSTVIRAFGWLVILGGDGIVNQALVAVGIGRARLLFSEFAVTIALVQLVLPLMVLPLMASIEAIPVDIEEAATNLGANAWSVFRCVVFPLTVPGLVSGIILSFAVAISVVVTPALLGGRRQRMVGNEIYDQVLTGLNWPFASALSLLLIVTVLAMLGLGGALTRRFAATGR